MTRHSMLWGGAAWLLLLGGKLQAQQRPAPPAKLAPALQQTAARGSAPQRVRLRASDAAAFAAWARRALPSATVQPVPGQAKLLELSGVAPAQLAELAASPLVEFVDVPNRAAHDELQLNQADLAVNGITPVHRRYPALTGQGLTVSVKENPFDPNDIDFRGRMVDVDPNATTRSTHATTMATLIAGGGNSSPAGKGAAWRARLATSDYANLLPDAVALLQRQGVSVQNHSYGTAVENYYGLEAQAYDAQTRQLTALLHVFSSGNSGNLASASGAYQGLAGVANLTGQFKMSKNTLSVGATDALGQVVRLSSRGPAHDGRVKPELVAFGEGGTSDAAALVSGIGLLVQHAYQAAHNGALPPAALVKAALLTSADDVGRPEVDFETGFGQADALGAVRVVLAGRHFSGSLGTGQEQVQRITVPAGTQLVKATLAWTDPEAAANANRALVNDLDLELVNVATGVRWQPWVLSSYAHLDSLAKPARRRPDRLNNVEQVTLAAPAPGTYELRVRGYAVPSGPQAFSVAYELSGTGFEWRAPVASRNLVPAAATQLRWQWSGGAATARLEYRPVTPTTAGAWRPVAPAAPLTLQRYAWTPPDTTTLVQLRAVVGAAAYISDTIALAAPVTPRFGYACSNEALVVWPRVPGATAYQVYQLGTTQLEPFRRTTDTAVVLTGAALGSGYYAVAPVFGSRLGERGTTVNLANAGLNCYVRSFLPEQAVADTVRLLTELGSTYNLRTLRLQRLQQGTFATIETVSPVTQTEFVFADFDAAAGLNQYRLELVDAAGRVFHSQTESVLRVPPRQVLVYPVPVAAGTPLNVAGTPGAVLRLRLYDALGRLLRESTLDGAINAVPTDGLRGGTYLLRIATDGAPDITRRVVVVGGE